MTIPVWLFVTFIYAVLLILLFIQMSRESGWMGGLSGCFFIPLLTVLYMAYWIIHLATGLL